MTVTKDEVGKVADLANLRMEDDEAEGMTRDLNEILAFVEKLRELDVGDVPVRLEAAGGATPLRPDVVRPFPGAGEILDSACERREDFFSVPRVIEEG